MEAPKFSDSEQVLLAKIAKLIEADSGGGGGGGVLSFNSRTGVVTLTSGDVTTALGFTPAVQDSVINLPYSSGTVDIDFSNPATFREIILDGNLVLTTSNRAVARSVTIRLIGDGAVRDVTFPAAWRFIGEAAPTELAGGKEAILTLFCFGPDDADIRAAYAAEP